MFLSVKFSNPKKTLGFLATNPKRRSGVGLFAKAQIIQNFRYLSIFSRFFIHFLVLFSILFSQVGPKEVWASKWGWVWEDRQWSNEEIISPDSWLFRQRPNCFLRFWDCIFAPFQKLRQKGFCRQFKVFNSFWPKKFRLLQKFLNF